MLLITKKELLAHLEGLPDDAANHAAWRHPETQTYVLSGLEVREWKDPLGNTHLIYYPYNQDRGVDAMLHDMEHEQKVQAQKEIAEAQRLARKYGLMLVDPNGIASSPFTGAGPRTSFEPLVRIGLPAPVGNSKPS